MNKKFLLAFGITILFLGLSINPTIAVNPISSDNEEDCDICPKVSKTHLVRFRSLINRVETLDNKLSVISNHNPEVAEKYQELFDRITTLVEMNKELNPDSPLQNYQKICSIIVPVFSILQMIGFFHIYLSASVKLLQRPMITAISNIYDFIWSLIWIPPFLISFILIHRFECIDWEDYK